MANSKREPSLIRLLRNMVSQEGSVGSTIERSLLPLYKEMCGAVGPPDYSHTLGKLIKELYPDGEALLSLIRKVRDHPNDQAHAEAMAIAKLAMDSIFLLIEGSRSAPELWLAMQYTTQQSKRRKGKPLVDRHYVTRNQHVRKVLAHNRREYPWDFLKRTAHDVDLSTRQVSRIYKEAKT